MPRTHMLLRVRGPVVGGVLVPLAVLVFGVATVFGVGAVVADLKSGNPFPVTGGRSGGPIAVVERFSLSRLWPPWCFRPWRAS